MSWAYAKQILELNWRQEWIDIRDMTLGEQPEAVVSLVLHVDELYKTNDREGVLLVKNQLQSLCCPGSRHNQIVTPGKSTGTSTIQASPTLWDVTEDASLLSK